jgi:hypothetical protein
MSGDRVTASLHARVNDFVTLRVCVCVCVLACLFRIRACDSAVYRALILPPR